MGNRCGRLQLAQTRDAGGAVVKAVDTSLKFLLQIVQHTAFERLDRLRLAGHAVFADSHASRIVHQNGNDVLLRPQLRHHNGRLPQQNKHDRGERSLQQPDDAGAPALKLGRRLREF